jgi:hypothetical protein
MWSSLRLKLLFLLDPDLELSAQGERADMEPWPGLCNLETSQGYQLHQRQNLHAAIPCNAFLKGPRLDRTPEYDASFVLRVT